MRGLALCSRVEMRLYIQVPRLWKRLLQLLSNPIILFIIDVIPRSLLRRCAAAVSLIWLKRNYREEYDAIMAGLIKSMPVLKEMLQGQS